MKEIVVITGGASGLGYEMAKLFLKKGFNIAIIGRTYENIKKVKELEVQVKNNDVLFYLGDIRDEDFVKNTIQDIVKDYNISFLINNASIIKACHFSENSKEDLDDVLGGVVGAILLTTNVVGHMKKNNFGKIVNILSSAALMAKPLESMYCCAKSALKGFNNSLKNELIGTNVKVVGVYPGGMNTVFHDRVRNYTSKTVSDKFMNVTRVAEIIVENCLQIDTLNISEIKIDRI